MSDPLDLCADALFAAWRDRVPLASLDQWLAPGDLAAAYAVQDRFDARMRDAGRVLVGWKVGVTSPAGLAAMGAHEPMAGRIYADSVLAAPARFARAQGCEPQLEGEVLFEFGDNPLAADDDDAALAELTVSVRPAFEIADTVGNPLKLRLSARLAWSSGSWTVQTIVNHSGAYRDPEISPERKVGSWTTVDLNVGYQVDGSEGWLAGTRCNVGVINLLDRSPPFVNQFDPFSGNFGYDAANASLLGRQVSLQVVKRWGQ